MPELNEFLDDLFLKHALPPYDPVKAHEYYLRTRELQGKPVAAQPSTPIGKLPATKVAPTARKPAAPPVKSADQLRKETEAKVAALTAKLAQLQKILAALVKEAKARGGVKTPTKATPADSKATTGSKSGTSNLTAAQKAEKAKKAKAAYDKAHPANLKTQEKDLETKIADATKKIHDLKLQIATAKRLASAHSTSSSVGVRVKTNK